MPKKQLQKKQPLQKKSHVSYSQILNGKCLHKYKTINLLKEIDVKSEPMIYGSMVHQVIYEYTKQCIKEKLDGDFELMDSLIDKHFKKSKLDDSIYAEVRQNLLQFAESGFNLDNILGYEYACIVNIDNGVVVDFDYDSVDKAFWLEAEKKLGQGIKVIVIIDRVNSYQTEEGSVLEIVDYKNQMNIDSKSKVEAHIQLQMYKYIASEFLFKGYDFVRVGIYHTRYNFIRWGTMQRTIDCGQEFENTDKFLRRQWERLILTEDDKYLPEKGSACWDYGGCDVMLAGKCPLFSKASVEKMMKGDSLDDKIRSVRKLDIDRSALLKEIKTEYKTKESENIDGGAVGYVASQSYSYDLDKFVKFAKENKIPLSGLTLSMRATEKNVKSMIPFKVMDEGIEEDLKECRIENCTTKFKY